MISGPNARIGLALLLGSTTVGWLGAFTTSGFIERQLQLPEEASLETATQEAPSKASAPPSKPRANRSKPNKSRYTQSILARNIFDSSKVNQAPVVTEGDQKISDLDVTLMGTVVAEPQEFSAALIKENSGGTTRGYGVGDMVLEVAKIIRIEQKKVVLERNGETEYIEISDNPKNDKKKTSKTSKTDEADGVSKLGKNQYVVDQEVLDQILENPEKLYSQIRVSPVKENGETTGYRLSGIRRKSLFYKLGVKNGDIVHSVNGKPLTSTSSAIDAYKSLSSSRNFSFDITRRRKRQTFEYDVR